MKKTRNYLFAYIAIFSIATILAGGWLWGIGACVAFKFMPIR